MNFTNSDTAKCTWTTDAKSIMISQTTINVGDSINLNSFNDIKLKAACTNDNGDCVAWKASGEDTYPSLSTVVIAPNIATICISRILIIRPRVLALSEPHDISDSPK